MKKAENSIKNVLNNLTFNLFNPAQISPIKVAVQMTLVCTLFSSQLALGAEVDNFNSKNLNLPDQSRELNDLTNKYLENVVSAANQASKTCDETILRQALKQVFSNHMKSLLINDLLKNIHFPVTNMNRKDSIYKEWKVTNGFILATSMKSVSALSLSPLIKVGDIDIGVDKLEHMFGMGHKYYSHYYEKNHSIDKVLGNGVTWEKTLLGGNIAATGVYAYADLAANFNGMRFWNNILMKNDDILGSEYNRGPYVECVNNQWKTNRDKPIDFTHYVDESFDESINCSKFATRNGANKIKKALSAEELQKVSKCGDNKEKLHKLFQKYSPHGINKYILNYQGVGTVKYLNEVKTNNRASTKFQ